MSLSLIFLSVFLFQVSRGNDAPKRCCRWEIKFVSLSVCGKDSAFFFFYFILFFLTRFSRSEISGDYVILRDPSWLSFVSFQETWLLGLLFIIANVLENPKRFAKIFLFSLLNDCAKGKTRLITPLTLDLTFAHSEAFYAIIILLLAVILISSNSYLLSFPLLLFFEPRARSFLFRMGKKLQKSVQEICPPPPPPSSFFCLRTLLYHFYCRA